MADYTTGDIGMTLKVTSEKDVTIDFIVNEATSMWRVMKSRKLVFGDNEGADALMDEMRKQHPEFCKSYPMVNRYICQMQEYDSKTFRLWLMKIKERPWKTEMEYLDAQADYVTMLFRHRKPRANQTELNNLRKNIRHMLQVEHEKFKHYATEFHDEVTAEEELLRDRNNDELHDFVSLIGVDGIALAETIRVETDLVCGPGVDVDGYTNNIGTDIKLITSDYLLD